MKYNFNITILILLIFVGTSTFLLGYSCIFNTEKNKYQAAFSNTDSLTQKTNTFQKLISNYSETLDTFDSIEKRIEDLKMDSIEVLDSINLISKLLITKENKLNHLKIQHLCDTIKIKPDSCLLIINNKLDSLAILTNDITVLNDKIITLTESLKNIIKNINNDKKKKYKLDNAPLLELKELQNYTTKIEGEVAVKFRGIQYIMFIANLDSCEVAFHLKDPKTSTNYFSINALLQSQALKDKKTLMLTNGGMYMPNFLPKGLFIENYNLITPIDTASPNIIANFYLKPNGVFFIDSLNNPFILDTKSYVKNFGLKANSKIKYATQSGPLLVTNNSIHPKFIRGSQNYKIRSGVGIINKNKIIFVLTRDEVNFYDFATFFHKIFQCEDALFLDGTISKMYLPGINANEKGGEFGPLISVTKK